MIFIIALTSIELSRSNTQFDWTAWRRGAVVVVPEEETINEQATFWLGLAEYATRTSQ